MAAMLSRPQCVKAVLSSLGYGMTDTMLITCNPREHNKPSSIGVCVSNTIAKVFNYESFPITL